MTIAKGLVDAFKSKNDCDTNETRLLNHQYFASVVYPFRQYLRFADDSWLMLEFSKEGFIRKFKTFQGGIKNGYTKENQGPVTVRRIK